VVKPSHWLAGCLIIWGVCATLQAVCTNAGGLIAVRFVLGVTEATVAPGCAFYLSFWYLNDEIALRIAAYAGTSAISGVVGGLIAYGFGSARHVAVKNWQAVFIVEGVSTIFVGLLTVWILPDRPENGRSHWFTHAEHGYYPSEARKECDKRQKRNKFRAGQGVSTLFSPA
jgi:sugar phosphate permease